MKHGGKEEPEDKKYRGFARMNTNNNRLYAQSAVRGSAVVRFDFLPPFPLFLRVSKILGFDNNQPIVRSPMLNRNLHVPLFARTSQTFLPTRSAGCFAGSSDRRAPACQARAGYRCGRDRCDRALPRGPRYSWIRVKVGLVTSSALAAWKPSAMPLTMVVFPAPRSPRKKRCCRASARRPDAGQVRWSLRRNGCERCSSLEIGELAEGFLLRRRQRLHPGN